jgi:2-hydroxy-6-oxonona-2,4-dienedioate hydrolase
MSITTAAHPEEVKAVHEKILSGSKAKSRFIRIRSGHRIHVIEAGDGPPVLLFNGSGPSALHMLPMLEKVDGVWAIAVDRPGFGLSDPAEVAPEKFRQGAVEFVDGVLDALGLDDAVIGGNSMGGTISTWYALARPERVRKLLLIGAPPLFPGTTVPGMLRMIATPVGTVLGKLMKPSPKLVVQNMKAFGEGDTITRYPELIDAQVIAGSDMTYANTSMAELKTIISVRGFKPEFQLSVDDLRRIKAPTQIVWGTNDPLGGADVAKAITAEFPDALLELLDAGHGPWFGHPEKVARLIDEFAG